MDEEENIPSKGIRKRHIFGAVFMLFIILVLIVWWQRTQIADRFVQNQIEEYGAQAGYKIENVGFRTQRVTNLVIGDPSNPDLTVKELEVDLKLDFNGAAIQWVRAKGVRLKARLEEDGSLKMGEVDKFLPEPSDEAFEFPDFALDAEDVVISLATPWGAVGASFQGLGQLRGQFEGELSLSSPKLANGGCSLNQPQFNGAVLLSSGSPQIIGPLEAAAISCSDPAMAIKRPIIDADLKLSDSFDRWVGGLGFKAQQVRFDGQNLSGLVGNLEFEGGEERTNFSVALNEAGFANDIVRVGQLALNGEGRLSFSEDGFSMAMRGNSEIARAKMDGESLTAIDDAAQGAADTPVGPLLERLGPAARQALADFGAGVDFNFAIPANSGMKIDIDNFDAASVSGAKIRQSGTLRLESRSSGWMLATPFQVALSGGGMPDGNLSLRSNGQGWAGKLALANYVNGDARLAINDLAFSGRPGGAWNFDGNALLSGPLFDGRVENLRFPVAGVWSGALLKMYNRCSQLSFDQIRYSGFNFGAQSLSLCPKGANIVTLNNGQVKINAHARNLALKGNSDGINFQVGSGQLGLDMLVDGNRTNFAATMPRGAIKGSTGGTPFSVSGSQISFNLDKGLRASDILVEVGAEDSKTNFNVADLRGRPNAQGFAGTLSGGGGQIANVPFLLSDAEGDWTFSDGAIRLLAALNFKDAEEQARFEPMQAKDVVVDYKNGTITAIADIHEPTTGTRVAGTDILHNLNNAEGRALISVEGINFNPAFQPELLTPLTLGVVANVSGIVDGDGRIEWDDSNDGIKSSGDFGTDYLDLAAAFGPVTGLKTRLKFTDLLALETAPGQVATIDSINPGIAALNGLVKYSLLPDQKVRIEGGEWPFAGGELILEDTTWDMAEDKSRHLLFRVKGIQIDRFLAQFDFNNLSATGTFDGVLPMVFDSTGGRIVGGEIISREEGGNISYIGDLTYEDLSPYANFAFDALRSLDYSSLRLGLNGELEGEIITIINFKGVKQGKGARSNFITRQLAKIPIEFNLQVEAQFFQLMTSVRSFYDPEFLVQQNLSELLKNQERAEELAKQQPNNEVKENAIQTERSVQPRESGSGL